MRSTFTEPTVDAPAGLRGVEEPRFWSGVPGTDPARFTVDASGAGSLLDPDGDIGLRMRKAFDTVGLVHVVGTGLTELADMRVLARHVLGEQMRYEGGSNPRAILAPNVYEVGAPLEAWLHYHHEMAYIGHSTEAVAFLCKAALPDGRGDTYVADNVVATDAILATELGRRLRALGVRYQRDLTDHDAFVGRVEYGVYNHWQQSFGTDDPTVAERRANERGLETDWGPARLLRTWYTVSAFELDPHTGRNLLFSSVADHASWFDAWPLVRHLPMAQRPLKMTFGDGTPFADDELEGFVRVYADAGQPIRWSPGDVAVVCNYRWAHGRPAIVPEAGESRELGVLLGRTFERQGDLPGGWPN